MHDVCDTFCALKVTGTCAIHAITSTRFRPTHFLTHELVTGVWLHDALAPPTEIHKFWEHSSNLFHYVQNWTFSFRLQLASFPGRRRNSLASSMSSNCIQM